jgi:hypothetical protein
MERYLTRIGKTLVALGGESCSSCREPEVTVAFRFISERTVHVRCVLCGGTGE